MGAGTELRSVSAYRQRGDSAYFGDAEDEPSYRLQIPVAELGYYRIYAWWPDSGGLDPKPAASYSVRAGSQLVDATLNQSELAGEWHFIAEVPALDSSELELRVTAVQGHSLWVDAFRVVRVEGATPFVITTDTLPIAVSGEPFDAQLRTSVGDAEPVSWRALSALPRGLRLDAESGRLGGIATDAGSFELQIQATSAKGETVSAEMNLEVMAGSPPLASRSLDRPLQPAQARSMPGRRTLNIEKSAKPDALDLLTSASTGTSGLLDIVAAMPEGTWYQASLNRYQDVWSPPELRPLKGRGNPAPSRIILPWSSFAWDDAGSNLYLFGGGHANYPGNDVYVWRGASRLWERASLPSEISQDDLGNTVAIDGVDNAPTSAHTYDNNLFLPVARRFLTYGGAAYTTGGPFRRQIGPDADRRTGPYVFNNLLADANKVGGTTGSHVQREGAFPDVVGGRMWQNRDLYGRADLEPRLPNRFVNGTTAVTVEDGRDVVYVTAVTGGTAQSLFKHTIANIEDPMQDRWEKVGSFGISFGGQGAGALDTHRNLYLRSARDKFVYWDLDNAGSSNRNRIFTAVDEAGDFVYNTKFGIDFSSSTGEFYLWEGFGDVFRLRPPDNLSTGDWILRKDSSGSADAPEEGPGRGVLGKWKYSKSLNAFVGLQNAFDGNVWLYKPMGWVAPDGGAPGLTVQLDSPASGARFESGANIAIAASANAQIDRVEFYVDGELLGLDSIAPYDLEWLNAPDGVYSLTAVALTEAGESATSAAVLLEIGEENALPEVNWLSPADASEWTVGEPIELEVTASDLDGTIQRVDFVAGGSVVASIENAPYRYSWSSAPPGASQLVAIAYDDDGANRATTTITIEVLNGNSPPSATLLRPGDGQSINQGEAVILEASVSDPDGDVERVEFYVNGGLLAVDDSAPFLFSWLDAVPGTYTVFARAVDSESASGDSDVAQITVSGSGGTVSVQLQEGLAGYAGTTDTHLSSWRESRNYGDEASVLDQTDKFVSLLRFALSDADGGPIPTGAIIQSATLSLYKHKNFNHDYALHRLLVNWSESEASWAESRSGVPWSGSGASGVGTDYLAMPDGSVSSPWGVGWTDIDVTGAVQDFVSGAVNHGWRLVPLGGNRNIKRFYSSEYSDDPSLRPRLTVVYETAGGQNQAPSVTIAAPEAESAFEEGDTVLIQATAMDPDGEVARVDFFVNDELLASDTTEPYSLAWTAGLAGDYFLSARAIDDRGASADSAAIMVSVRNAPVNQLPSVVISSPEVGSELFDGAPVVIEASANDADGAISRVDFFVGDNLVGADTSAPYSIVWSPAAPGSKVLSAVAVDDRGARAASQDVGITILSSNAPPEVTLVSPVPDSSFLEGDDIVLEAAASDVDGTVDRVEFYRDGELLAEVTTAPYVWSWTNAPVGEHILLARAVDNLGATADSDASSIDISGGGGQGVVVLQEGLNEYVGTRDTRITSWRTGRNYGEEQGLFDQGGRYVTLISFAIFAAEGGPVPDGATIEAATLSFYKFKNFDHRYGVHRMLRSWDEEQANWNQSRDGIPWSVVGAGGADSDYRALPDGEVSSPWGPGWIDVDVTAALEAFLAGEANYGWRLLPLGGNRNIKRFYSSEYPDAPELRPKLEVRYR